MPAIILFGRRTMIGGDDLQPGAVVTIIVRSVLQLALFIVPVLFGIFQIIFTYGWSQFSHLSNNNSDSTCTKAGYQTYPVWLLSYELISALYCLLSVGLETAICQISSEGTPSEPKNRSQKVTKLLEFRLTLMTILNLFVFCVGLYATHAARWYYKCKAINGTGGAGGNLVHNADEYIPWDVIDDTWITSDQNLMDGDLNPLNTSFPSSWRLWLIFLLGSQAIEVVSGFLGICALWSLPRASSAQALSSRSGFTNAEAGQSGANLSFSSSSEHLHQASYYGPMEEMWQNRCRLCCKFSGMATCYIFGGRDLHTTGDFTQIATVLTDYFEDGGALDIVPSDVVMGFMLLWRIQTQRQTEARRSLLSKISDRSNSLLQTSLNGQAQPSEELVIDLRYAEALNLVSTSSELSLASPNYMPNTASRTEGERRLNPVSEHATDLPQESPLVFSPSHTPSGIRHEALVYITRRDGSQQFYDCGFRDVLMENNGFDRKVMAEAARFARHSLAIYSWKLYAYMYPEKVVCTLMKWRCQRFFGACEGNNHKDPYIGDNTWHVHENAVLKHVGLHDKGSSPPCELVYARFDNGLRETPYCVLLDHAWKSIVISIRGSLSLEDCVIDVLCDPEPLENVGRRFGFDANGEFCHSGVLSRTEWLFQDLARQGVLERLYMSYPDYQLRVVGHSLGAGCAMVLGLMLKERYPSLRCLLYSPPGGLVTHRLATTCKEFVTSFILDNELVPRLSLQNMERLRDEVIELIIRTKVPKMMVVRDFVKTAAANALSKTLEQQEHFEFPEDNNNLLYPKGGNPTDSEFANQLRHFKDVQNERKLHRQHAKSEHVHVQMYPPGRIVHLVKTSQMSSCSGSLLKCLSCWTSNAGSQYTPMWAKNEDFDEILVSPTMGTDHFPNRVCLEIEVIAKKFGLKSPYTDLQAEFGDV